MKLRPLSEQVRDCTVNRIKEAATVITTSVKCHRDFIFLDLYQCCFIKALLYQKPHQRQLKSKNVNIIQLNQIEEICYQFYQSCRG